MDTRDKAILTAIQAELPAEERPFDAMAARLGMDAQELLARVRRMADDGLIRRIGPVFDSRGLGYASTLVAARVPADHIAEAAAKVSRLPGVTHNYERRGAYNLWFTLTASSAEAIGQTLETLRQETGAEAMHSLPALAVYKIRVQFDMADEAVNGDVSADGTSQPSGADPSRRSTGGPSNLDEPQKELVRILQEGLAVEREPFAAAAARLGWPVSRVVEQVRGWLAAGVIRRLGAVVRHRELGFSANGMAVFRLPPGDIDEAGRRLAAFTEVSHCYRRPPLPDFPYSLYAMVHGRSEEEVRATVERMATAVGDAAHDVLFSVREFKKMSMRYFVE
jgi:siroheme decarboxylase